MVELTSSCPRPEYETMFTAIVGGLFVEDRMPPGDVVDAGAYKGTWACFYARQDRQRRVLAIEPDRFHIEQMRREPWRSDHPNVAPLHGALSNESRAKTTRAVAFRSSMQLYPLAAPRAWYNDTIAFPTYTLDGLLLRSRTLGFAGLDVEGACAAGRSRLLFAL